MDARRKLCEDDSRTPSLRPFNPRGCLIFLLHFAKKYTMGKIKENWQLAVFITILSVVLSGMSAIIVNNVNKRSDKMETVASQKYVDDNNFEIKGYIDTQDGELKSRVQKNEEHLSIVEDKLDLKADKTEFQRVDQKLDKIYELLINKK